jgi:hypothetical protein
VLDDADNGKNDDEAERDGKRRKNEPSGHASSFTDRGVRTARGTDWHDGAVRNLLLGLAE